MSNINIVVAAQVQDAVSGLGQVSQATKRVGDQVDKATKRLKSHTNQYNRTAVATNKWAKGALQQAGYQVGDFAVQVANGTSGIQAFGQQGSQLLGVFGPIGAVLGAGVAIFSAVALAAERTSKSTTRLTFDFQKLGHDVKENLEPFITFVRPAIDLVSKGFDLLLDAAKAAINGIINGLTYFYVTVSHAPSIVKEAFSRAIDRIKLFGVEFQIMVNSLSWKWLEFTSGIREGFARSLDSIASMMNDVMGTDFATNNLDTALSGVSDTMSGLNDELVDLLQTEGKLRQELDKPFESYANLKKDIDNITQIDIFSYFKRVKKEGGDAAASVGDKVTTIADMIGEKFGDAFMSMVDGTMKAKDAFRAMAADIIKELYRVFVVKKITGFITGAISNAFPTLGNTPMKAIGGAVQRGKPYVVGERGPEMFVPSRSGSIIPNDKMSSGGGVTVVQNINVSTGVQQTVRTEIKSLMPQIAESAKAAVADAKRRGGSYGRAFA